MATAEALRSASVRCGFQDEIIYWQTAEDCAEALTVCTEEQSYIPEYIQCANSVIAECSPHGYNDWWWNCRKYSGGFTVHPDGSWSTGPLDDPGRVTPCFCVWHRHYVYNPLMMNECARLGYPAILE
jgi:hypothetical protein